MQEYNPPLPDELVDLLEDVLIFAKTKSNIDILI